jgi:methylated-DNA-[protein]-cysteine S-methyltransferase
MKVKCSFGTPLGEMIALAEQDILCELWFADQRYKPKHVGEYEENQDHPLFKTLRDQLDAYFTRRLLAFDLPLAPMGSTFQMAVWDLLRKIPCGATVTYGALARQLAEVRQGRLPAAQAVGGAVGRNPIEIIIPCHRVVGANGSLTGYAGGLERKAALLELEKSKPVS